MLPKDSLNACVRVTRPIGHSAGMHSGKPYTESHTFSHSGLDPESHKIRKSSETLNQVQGDGIGPSEASTRRDTPEESVTDASEGIPECFPQHDIF